MQFNWLKISAIVLLVYAVVGGLLLPVPELSQLGETIRNLYYHVCMWFAMMILYTISIIHSIKYLRNGKIEHDIKAVSYAGTGTYMGLLGMQQVQFGRAIHGLIQTIRLMLLLDQS